MTTSANMSHRHVKRKSLLAIIVASPLTENIYQRIGVGIFREHFDVIVIDCMEWVRKHDALPEYLYASAQNILKCQSKREFERIIRTEKPDFVLDFVGRCGHTRVLQSICRSESSLYIAHHLVPFPNPIRKNSLFKSLISSPRVTFKKGVSYLWRSFRREQPLPPDIALIAGAASETDWMMSAKKVIYTATPAYFEIENLKKKRTISERSLPDRYILFLDDCLALSFDFLLGGYSPVIDPDEYFSILNSFFSRLEDYFGVPVIIAAHPNGKEYKDYSKYFGGRNVYFDVTAELSIDCYFAMTHFSSAINYPVILRKRILLLNFNALKKHIQGLSLNYIASLLRCYQVGMDFERDESSLLESFENSGINLEAYEAYEAMYISNVSDIPQNQFEPLIDHLVSIR